MNPDIISAVIRDLSAVQGQALSMPLTKRMQLDEVIRFKKLVFGESIYAKLMKAGALEWSSSQVMETLYADAEFADFLSQRKFDHVTLVSACMVFRHLAKKAPVFTVNPALNLLLADTAIKENIPAQYFALPYPTCFIEFDPAERREHATHFMFSGGSPEACEGALLQETHMGDLKKLRQSTREALELDPNIPARIIEIGLSASPIHSRSAHETKMPVAFDNIDLITLYIQDEQESIQAILQRHFRFYEDMMAPIAHLTGADGRSFNELFEENFAYLTKVLFYLNVEKNQSRIENESSALENRLANVADKKKDKLRRQLHRVYDRVIIGPDHYTPIKDLMATDQHYRRGYFGIRWKGVGENKTAELIRVTHTIINEHLLRGSAKPIRPSRDYEIR
jgi:hypothetical protein